MTAIARDPMLQAQVWNALAWRARQAGDYGEVLGIAQAAVVGTAARRSGTVSALFHAWSAQGHGWAGQTGAADRSLARAQAALERPNEAPAPVWLTFFDHSEVDAKAAHVHLSLGHWRHAETAAQASLLGTPAGYTRNRLSRSLLVAQAQVGQREIEQAATTAGPALERIADVRSGRMMRRYRELRGGLAARHDVPVAARWVQTFDTRVTAS